MKMDTTTMKPVWSNLQLGLCISCKTQQHLRSGKDTKCVFCNKEGLRPTGKAINSICRYLLSKAARMTDIIDSGMATEEDWWQMEMVSLSLLRNGIDIRPHHAIHN